jgi:quinol monooxygenase YgiN
MYDLISKLNTVPGQRDALAAILIEGTQSMPGCLSYVIASDPADDNALWIVHSFSGEK